ncbi:hypothetical protein CTAYLR_007504 [Chrysophaeum taylorii]|uniref:Protein kinase domain-containing protein n=1 Tax=Chrysophaeum taylorii TaxID=2483200 RepID=A0AAD7UK48_9STRA|nr:hypothetical protein CTAYLR_007504 [Chrysophaeum taylorii]
MSSASSQARPCGMRPGGSWSGRNGNEGNGSSGAPFYHHPPYDRPRRREEPANYHHHYHLGGGGGLRGDEPPPRKRRRSRSRSWRRHDDGEDDYGARRSRRWRHEEERGGRSEHEYPRAAAPRATDRRRRRRDEELAAPVAPKVPPPPPPTNGDKDDSVGHYEGCLGDLMLDRYEILGDAGVGTFGRVVECLDRRSRQRVAIKVVRKIARYTESAAVEADILRDVNASALAVREPRPGAIAWRGLSPGAGAASGGRAYAAAAPPARGDRGAYGRSSSRGGGGRRSSSSVADSVLGIYSSCPPSALCVKLLATFDFRGHYCLVFERLGVSLYELLKSNNYRPFREKTVARMSRQLLEALAFLHDMRLVHTDLKLENVLLRDPEVVAIPDPRDRDAEPLKVPRYDNIVVIDFGGATYNDERKSSIINTRQYRAPEVILNVGWSMPSDLWSAGCIVAELRRGDLLFATHSNTEHIGLIEKCVGPFPRHMLDRSRYFEKYFDARTGRSKWASTLGREGRDHVRAMPSLEAYCGHDNALRQLLRGLLVIDPDKRLTAREALDGCAMLDPLRL